MKCEGYHCNKTAKYSGLFGGSKWKLCLMHMKRWVRKYGRYVKNNPYLGSREIERLEVNKWAT